MYGAGDYDLAGFTVGAVERSQLVDGSRIAAGHRVIGMASSGPHSNGYSLIRKVIERSAAELGDPLPGDDNQPATLGDALLAPTRIYVKPVLKLLESGRIDGLAHITGGGLTENISRVFPAGLGLALDTSAWRRPAIFRWLQQEGRISETEMLRTFNCGIGMVMLAEPDAVDPLITDAADLGIECFDIGEVIAGAGV
jgi:phosphoribosylformylglycinamidine cyclo-ligase